LSTQSFKYLKNDKEGIYGFKDFEINRIRSGAVEKNIEIIIGKIKNKR